MKTQFFARISYLDKVVFTKHMAVMIKSGITAIEALLTLKEQVKSQAFQKLVDEIVSDIENGQTLATALKKHPKVFDQFYVNIIHIGEESGNLEKNLEFLALQLTKDYNLQKKIQGALLYPAFILLGTFSVVIFITYFILPQLVTFFSSLEVELPLSTKIIIWVGKVMKSYGVFILAGSAAWVIGFRFLIEVSSVKKVFQRVLLSLPVLGPFLQISVLASFCRNLGVMLKSGLSIISSLQILSEGMSNLIFKDYVIRLKKAVTSGRNLSQELNSKNFQFIPPIMLKMIAVGEKTGKLDQSLLYLSDFFEEEIDTTAKNLSTLVEPVLLVVIGIVVGFIALAIITPIYQLTGSLRGR